MNLKPFIISRTFDIPKSLAWKYWTDAEEMKQWMATNGTKFIHSVMDFREGGSYHFGMQAPDGNEMWGKAYYEKIQPNDRVEYVNTFSDAQGGLTRHPLAPDWPARMYTILNFIESEPGKTTVEASWLPMNASPEELETFEQSREGMKMGWTNMFNQLEKHTKRAEAVA